jgi:hypothetical protein
MSFVTRLQAMLCGFVASAYVCNAAPFLLEFEYRDFSHTLAGATIVLEIPSLPVVNGIQPLSYVRSLDVWNGATDVPPVPPLMIT